MRMHHAIIGVKIHMKKTLTIATIICVIVSIFIYLLNTVSRSDVFHESTFVNGENILFLDGKREISLIHVSESELYFSAINESGYYNLYVTNFLDDEIIMLDYNIFRQTQYNNGYIYYTKLFDWPYHDVFRRVRISDGADGSPEDITAVDDFYVRGEQFTLSTAYVANGNYFSSMAHRDVNGNFTHTYIIRIGSSNEVSVIDDYLPPITELTWYENNLYFTGVNLREDGIYVVPDEGGMRRRLRAGSTTLLAISDGRIFFSTGRQFMDGIIDINYVTLYGCRKTNLFIGESVNVEVFGGWVYFIDLDDSSRIKRVNVYSKELQTLTDGRVQDFVINDSGEWLYYQRTYLMGSQILKFQIPNIVLVEEADNVLRNSANDSTPADDWRSKYIDYIFENNRMLDFRSTEFMLVHISDDKIPELIMDHNITSEGAVMFTFLNGRVESLWFPASSWISFVERENLFIISGGRMDFYFDRVYRIENGRFVLLYEGTYVTDFSGADASDFHWYWNDKEVSKDEYKRLLASVFDYSKVTYARENTLCLCETINKIRTYY